MENNKENMSIKWVIIIVFILVMLISTSVIGHLVFSRWFYSTGEITQKISQQIGENIYNQVDTFIHSPLRVNVANQEVIAKKIVDLTDDQVRDKYFVNLLQSQENTIHSIGYATVEGEYFGARRNKETGIEIIKNNNPERHLKQYSITKDMTAGQLIFEGEVFDPRSLAWYRTAVDSGKSLFYPIFKDIIKDDLAVSVVTPIYNDGGQLHGVLGTHMLLSGIGKYIEDAVKDYNGYAIILEKDTGLLIANSLNIDNFSTLEDGRLKHYKICEIDNSLIQEICRYYRENREINFVFKNKTEEFYVNSHEIDIEGLNLTIISAIPKMLYTGDAIASINLTIFLVLIAMILLLLIYGFVIGKLFRPIDQLLQVAGALSSGDLSKRVEVVRKDEIGSISQSLNKVGDKMEFLINNLETNVTNRTNELQNVNKALRENKDQLQLILDSTAEGIFGVDLDGGCVFCNISCLKILGYDNQDELIGKEIHPLIHHHHKDGKVFPIENCKIFQSINEGKNLKVDDEVFWRADGSFIDVEYHACPQIRDNEIVGGVVTFMDITKRKKREKEIEYLSQHDILTGLYNRRYFDENRVKIDIPSNLPLSVIFADINGLKMTNDIFGHDAGDQLIKKSAKIIMESCRNTDIVARVGGDEFIVLLPQTGEEEVQQILSRIRKGFLGARIEAIKCSISLGSATKLNMDQGLEEIITNAEDEMYKEKTMNRRSINKDIIDNIIDTLHTKYPREKRHSVNVSQLCREMGILLNFSKAKINKLERAGYFHDIGKVILDESILFKENLTEEEGEKMQQHSVVGYRILNLFDDMVDLAEYVYGHHEMWNGKGYPRGLKGEEIPMISRIISIVETYDRTLHAKDVELGERKENAIQTIKKGAGQVFDPRIAEVFIQMMENKDLEN